MATEVLLFQPTHLSYFSVTLCAGHTFYDEHVLQHQNFFGYGEYGILENFKVDTKPQCRLPSFTTLCLVVPLATIPHLCPVFPFFFSLSVCGKEQETVSNQVLVYAGLHSCKPLGLHSHWLLMDSTGGRWRTQVSDQTPAPSPAAKLQTGVMRILPLGKGSGEHKAGADHSLRSS